MADSTIILDECTCNQFCLKEWKIADRMHHGKWAFAIYGTAAVSLRGISSTCGHQIGPVCLSQSKTQTGGIYFQQLHTVVIGDIHYKRKWMIKTTLTNRQFELDLPNEKEHTDIVAYISLLKPWRRWPFGYLELFWVNNITIRLHYALLINIFNWQ